MDFTQNQKLAIDIRDKNVLVSAAAGAGKTAVLVQRILERITDPKNPVDVDRLLVMTFTNAAAQEMRERILKAIEKKRENNPEDSNLYRQSMLVHNAHITTIHGFCQSLIRDNFESLNINPDFRVGDDNECTLLQKDVVAEILEEAYAEGSESFLKCVECFSPKSNDSKLEELILTIFKFSQSDPDPKGWLERCLSIYEVKDGETFESHPYTLSYIARSKQYAKGLCSVIENLIDYVSADPILEQCATALSNDLESLENFISLFDSPKAYSALCNAPAITWARMAAIKDDSEETEAKKKYITNTRKYYKDRVKSLTDEFALSADENVEMLNECKEQVRALVRLVCDFSDRFAQKKREKNIIDFNDMEHLAIKVLSENEQIAASYRDFFEEIYVDEYQDSNMAQERLLELIGRKGDETGNLFMVGDVKQSIYRFRQARPDLFVAKYTEYAKETDGNFRILLNDNFRSRTQVVDSVNEIFRAIMTTEHGEIDYDEQAELKGKAVYPEEGMMDESCYTSRIMMAKKCDGMSAEETEAHMIAARISEIHDSYVVWDKDREVYRPVKYSDIAVLVRSIKSWDKVITNVFEAHDIPVNIASLTGYFSSVEVTTVMAFVSVVDNPMQDIELATFLRSEVCDFSDEDLAVIKLKFGNEKKMRLYEKVRDYALLDEDENSADELIKKCRTVVNLLKEYRECALYYPIHEVLKKFIDEVYGPFVKAMYDGEVKIANLNMLIKKAEDYSRTSYKGLFHFVRYIKQIRKYDVDFGEASLTDENNDAVCVMTIHGSKGLEFPVCFVAGLTKKRFSKDESNEVMLSASYGIGVDSIDLDRRTRKTTFVKNLIKKELYRDNLAEEMRVLYVALTRARENLILTGVIDTDSIFEKSKNELVSWNNYFDFINYAHSKLGYFKSLEEVIVTPEELVGETVADATNFLQRKEKLLDAVRSDMDCTDMELLNLREWLMFKYPHREREGSFYKMSVSDLKRLKAEAIKSSEQSESELAEDTHEMYKGPSKGAFYGTAFHRLLELWDYKNAPDEITAAAVSDFVLDMRSRNMIDDDQKEAVNTEEIRKFLTSALAERMKRAAGEDYLYREQPFVIGVKSSEISAMQGIKDEAGDGVEYDDDLCLVQGIIDAFFVEDGHIVIVDYKTDRVNEEEELVKKYRIQLEYYAKALSKLMDMPVSQLIIYSSRLGKEIVI